MLTPLFPSLALAQEDIAGRVVAPTYAPGTVSENTVIDLGEFSGAEPPPGSEAVVISPKELVFNGAPSPLPQAMKRMRDTLLGKPDATVADLYSAAATMEREISSAGYVLVRVILPPQRIERGDRVTVLLVDGHIETIDSDALPAAVRATVMARVSPLLNRPALQKKQIERALLLAGDVSGLTLRSTFLPGENTGGVKLHLEGTYMRVTGSLSADNQASESVGDYQASAALAFNGLFRSGELTYLSYTADLHALSKTDARQHIMALGSQVPIGISGLTLVPEVVYAQILPEPTPGVPDSENLFARASVRFSYPLVRQVEHTAVGSMTLEQVAQRVELTGFNLALSSDSYRVLRGAISFQQQKSARTALSCSLQIARGLGEAKSLFTDGKPTGQTGFVAPAVFTKVNATLSAGIRYSTLSAQLTARLQSALGKPLLAAEQLNLSGNDALSSLAAGALVIDQGGTLRAEAGTNRTLGHAVTVPFFLYGFAAYGTGSILAPTAVETPKLNADSVGVGARTQAVHFLRGRQAATFALEAGRNRTSVPNSRPTWRLSGSLAWSF